MTVIPDPATTDWVPLWSTGTQFGQLTSIYEAAASGAGLTLTTTSTDIPGCTITFSVNQPSAILVVGTFDADVSALGCAWLAGTAVIDGAVISGQALLWPSVTGRASIASTWRTAVAPGSHTLKLQGTKGAAGGTAVFNGTHTKFTMIVVEGSWTIGARFPPTYGTTLPTNPSDGQEHILVDSITNPTYQWHFRYNAFSTSPYKWEFVGGAAVYITVGIGVWENVTGNQTWQDCPTIGPRLMVPRAGDYECLGGAQCGGSASLSQIGWAIGTALGVVQDATTIPASGMSVISIGERLNGVAAGSDVRLRYWGNTATAQFANRWAQIRPVRVS